MAVAQERKHELLRASEFLESDDDIIVLKAEVQKHNEKHEHDFIELVYVVSGQGKHIIQEDSVPIQQGDIFLLNAHVAHEYYADKGSTLLVYNCLFQPLSIDRSFQDCEDFLDLAYRYLLHSFHSEENPKGYLKLIGKQNQECKALFDNMYQEYHNKEDGYRQILKANLTALLILIFRLYKNSARKAQDIPYYRKLVVEHTYQYIKEHYRENIKCEDMAAHSYLSTSCFDRIFKEVTGITAISALQNYRMEVACDLLLHSKLSMKEIVCAVGYSDQKHFYDVFRKIKGTTPGDFRKQKVEFT